MDTFYSIPIHVKDILSKQRREQYTCSLDTSIGQNINLIISTKFQEFRFDPDYGCSVWEVDFVVPSNINLWKEEIKAALEKAILQYDKRIEQIREFSITVEEDPRHRKRNNQILHIRIQGSVKGTSEEFEYRDTLFFSPYAT